MNAASTSQFRGTVQAARRTVTESVSDTIACVYVQVAVSCCRSGARDNGFKDSAANILATEEFVVNIMSAWFVEAANHTCGNYDPGVNEFELAGLTPLPSAVVAPPRVAESAVHMECKLRHHYHVQNSQVRS